MSVVPKWHLLTFPKKLSSCKPFLPIEEQSQARCRSLASSEFYPTLSPTVWPSPVEEAMTSVKKLWLLLGILAVVLSGTSSLVAQDQLNLHDAGLNNLFTGGSSQLNPRQINLTMETQNCPGQLCVFGLSTATGTGHLQSSGNYTITTPKGAPVMGGFAGPFFLTVQSDGHSIVTQTAPITFSYTSTQGTLTGSLRSPASRRPRVAARSCGNLYGNRRQLRTIFSERRNGQHHVWACLPVTELPAGSARTDGTGISSLERSRPTQSSRC